MRKDVKDKWVEVLNSGKHHQIRLFLATNDGGRCALGVLADLAVEAGVVARYNFPPGNEKRYSLTYGNYTFSLPPAVHRWAEITERDAQIIMGMNESGKSFSEIAGWIKDNL
jgi:hypothetical protein